MNDTAWYREWKLAQAMDRHAEALRSGSSDEVIQTRTDLRVAAAQHDIAAVDDDGDPLETIAHAVDSFRLDVADGLVLPIDIEGILRGRVQVAS